MLDLKHIILTLIAIAMKSYFLFPILIFYSSFSPFHSYSQEISDIEEHTSPDATHSFETNELEKDPTPLHSYPLDEGILEPWHHPTPREGDSFESKFFNMLFILGLLIAFMLLASWSLKRMMRNKMTNLNTGSEIKVLETRYLSPRATLYLVEINNQNFLIAESPTTVTYLATLPENNETSYRDG